MRRLVTISLLAALIAAGCGSNELENPTAKEIATCLRGGPHEPTSVEIDAAELDLVAAEAGDGGILVEWGGNGANIAVERSEGDAENTEAAYRVFAAGLDVNVDELLHRRGNVVVVYSESPVSIESDLINGCTPSS